MSREKAIIGFIGAGGIARSHAYSINSLRYFYNDPPEIELEAVCSATQESRLSFAKQYGFAKSPDIEEFVANKKINTVYILGPNKVHFEHLKAVIKMPSVKRIYLEKPVCSNLEEELAIADLVIKYPDTKIQVGFQYLFTASVREALSFWKSGKLGKTIHFALEYYHSDYLQKEYRDRRLTRLTPAPDGGTIFYDGSDISRLKGKALASFRNNNIGFVFQFHQLLPEFTALENVCIPAYIAGKSKIEAENRANELLGFLNLSERINHKPSELSGGEQQRVAVARALVNNPSVILADEPPGNLDTENKNELHKLFFQLRDTFGQTIIIVTHDRQLANMSDRILQIKDGLIVDEP